MHRDGSDEGAAAPPVVDASQDAHLDTDDAEDGDYEDEDEPDSLMLDEDDDAPNLVREERPRNILAGRYEILEKIGEGGMGAVWRGRHLKLDRLVAVKVLDESLQLREDGRERFIREGRALALLVHRNVVSVYDCDQLPDGKLYLCMELLDGETLRSIIKRGERLDPLAVVDIGLQVCDATQAAHERGILHRDLTPSNIIRLRDEARTIKVIDWGLCKYLDLFYARSPPTYGAPPGSRLVTPLGCRFGTPEYMAPEMILRENPGPPSFCTDVYALGIVLYELLTGRHPFKPGDRKQSRPVRELLPGFDYDDLESALRNAMRYSPDERTPTMAALREDLDLARECIVAQREANLATPPIVLLAPGADPGAAGSQPDPPNAAPVVDVAEGDAEEVKPVLPAAIGSPLILDESAPPPSLLNTASLMVPAADARGWIAAHKVGLALAVGMGLGGGSVLGVQKVSAWYDAQVTAPLTAALQKEAARAHEAEARAEVCEEALDVVTDAAALPSVEVTAKPDIRSMAESPAPRPMADAASPVDAAKASPELRAARERRRASARVLDGALDGVRGCYDRHGGSRQTELKVRVRLDAAGKAEDVKVLGDTATSTLQSCIASAVRAHHYPVGEDSVSITHNFALRKP